MVEIESAGLSDGGYRIEVSSPDLVGNSLSIASALDSLQHSRRASSDSRTGEAEGIHDGLEG